MKKSLLGLVLISLLVLNLIVIVYAEGDMPSAGIGDEEYDKLNNLTGIIPLDPSTGGIDPTKFNQTKSKAEERIAAIDDWMKNNASWLKWIFGMVPEISWLFAINFLLILTFLNGLVLNAQNVFIFFSKGVARLVGLGAFLGLLLSKFILNGLARPATDFITSWWVRLIIIVALIALNPLIAIYFKHASKQREKRAKQQEEFDRERLHGDVEVAETFTKELAK